MSSITETIRQSLSNFKDGVATYRLDNIEITRFSNGYMFIDVLKPIVGTGRSKRKIIEGLKYEFDRIREVLPHDIGPYHLNADTASKNEFYRRRFFANDPLIKDSGEIVGLNRKSVGGERTGLMMIVEEPIPGTKPSKAVQELEINEYLKRRADRDLTGKSRTKASFTYAGRDYTIAANKSHKLGYQVKDLQKVTNTEMLRQTSGTKVKTSEIQDKMLENILNQRRELGPGFEAEHSWPRSKGGPINDPSFLKIASWDLNAYKGNRPIDIPYVPFGATQADLPALGYKKVRGRWQSAYPLDEMFRRVDVFKEAATINRKIGNIPWKPVVGGIATATAGVVSSPLKSLAAIPETPWTAATWVFDAASLGATQLDKWGTQQLPDDHVYESGATKQQALDFLNRQIGADIGGLEPTGIGNLGAVLNQLTDPRETEEQKRRRSEQAIQNVKTMQQHGMNPWFY